MTTMRISGISSGLDVDSIVKQLMTAQRVPLDKLNQQKQVLQWQRDNYREINSKLVDFRNNKLMKFNTSVQMNTQSSTVSGDTAALKAEATADANGIEMNIKVLRLAKPATQTSSGATMVNTTLNTRITSSSTLSELNAINTGTSPDSDGNFKITINGNSIKIPATSTISDALTQINKTDAAKVTAKFDEATGKLVISSKEYSTGGKVVLDTTPAASDTFEQLFGSSMTKTDYQTAQVQVNGGSTIDYASNSFKLNGVSLTLLAPTTTSAKVTTTTDSSKAVETIKAFVTAYNDLLSTLTTKNTEERYKDYTPLTDEQKKEMSDSDVENWETKAKSGLLKNDDILKSTISSMRSIITSKLGDLSAAGITTGQYYENGKLYIDEDKLKAALEANPQQVTGIFQGSKGLYSSMSDKVYESIQSLASRAGTSKYSSDVTAAFNSESVMGKSLTDYTKRISDLQDKLDDMETAYYKKFTAMETAMANYSSQSSSLTSMLS
ncbi:flagellar filament capping protein FliD [Paenibacillus sp. NFR01]|uniref:flagellar filament capping protein FliD n=1 Tax=Paenibacillus sp. NFR01 TaxID=1566279 RepID=UPI0008AF2458|nr:flagellar filament capping protein FliD [Paenibacillus sp. NFR01]SEU14360.1 flagellar hook-associated protein 2 [Paenibacillus sp. NFR01]